LNSIEDYDKQVRNDWILLHPGQCVLNGSQVKWTQEVEDAIKSRSTREYYAKLENQILKLVTIPRDNLSSNQKVTIEALIVVDVHAKDTVQVLIKWGVDEITFFEWVSQ
jgi:dynein heavy chain